MTNQPQIQKHNTLMERIDRLIEEAKEFTTVEEAMNRCPFTDTGYDHFIRLGTPSDKRMWDNPNTPRGELMSDNEFEDYITGLYERNKPNCPPEYDTYDRDLMRELQIVNPRDMSPLAGALFYLSSVGRVPQKYAYLVANLVREGGNEND